MARHWKARLALTMICTASATLAAPPATVPVMIGTDELMDACPTLARPARLKAGGDGFLSLRAGPGTGFREIARLVGTDRLFVCAERNGWSAVVVQAAGKNCGVSTPRAGRTPYRGPCRSGWVATRFLHILAG